MTIYTSDKIEVNVDFSAVHHADIDYCDTEMILAYNDPELNKTLEDTIYAIASNCDWCYPDLENTQTYLVANVDNRERNYEAYLFVVVKPPHLTYEDIDGFFITEEVVMAALDFYNSEQYSDDRNTESIAVTLNEREFEKLKDIKRVADATSASACAEKARTFSILQSNRCFS